MIGRIIGLLPSADLKKKIAESGHSFNEIELLTIIYKYSPDFDTRIKMLEEYLQTASHDVSMLAKAYIEHEQDKLSRFTQDHDGFVYELCIKDTPDSYEEKYLCTSYKAALTCIDRFYEEYASLKVIETDETRYKIIKRKVFSDNDSFEEDEYAEMKLGRHKTILNIEDYKYSSDCGSELSCYECKEICPLRCHEVRFPSFAYNYDIIKFSDYEDKEHFGVTLCWTEPDGLKSEFYVISLDFAFIREHRFDIDFYDHHHIELPLATLATPEDLDEKMREDYYAFVDYLKTSERY